MQVLAVKQNLQDQIAWVEFSVSDLLIVRYKYNRGVMKTHRLNYEALDDILHAKYNHEYYAEQGTQWTLNPKSLLSWMLYFGNGLEEVSMTTLPDGQVKFASFLDGAIAAVRRSLATELTLSRDEFEQPNIRNLNPLTITFSLREFKSILALSDAVGSNVSCAMTHPGSPVVFQFNIGTFYNAEFVLATFSEDDEERQQENSGQQEGDQTFIDENELPSNTQRTNTGAVLTQEQMKDLVGDIDLDTFEYFTDNDENGEQEEIPQTPPHNSRTFSLF